MLPSAVCCLIAAYSPLLSSAEAKKAADSLVGIVTCLLTGNQQNCASFLAVARDNFLYQGNNTSCGVELATIQWVQRDLPSDYVTLVCI